MGTYLNLLLEWFKNNNFTPQVVAAAYMTGIIYNFIQDDNRPQIDSIDILKFS